MKKFLTYLLYIVCIALLILELYVDKSSLHFNVEKYFAVFAIAGFLSTFFYVICSNVLKKVVLKDKDFYDKH